MIEAAGGRGSAYENRREADRIFVVASRPLRDTSFKPYVYTAATFLPATPPRIAPIEKPAPRVMVPMPVLAPNGAHAQASAEVRVNVPLPQPRSARRLRLPRERFSR